MSAKHKTCTWVFKKYTENGEAVWNAGATATVYQTKGLSPETHRCQEQFWGRFFLPSMASLVLWTHGSVLDFGMETHKNDVFHLNAIFFYKEVTDSCFQSFSVFTFSKLSAQNNLYAKEAYFRVAYSFLFIGFECSSISSFSHSNNQIC